MPAKPAWLSNIDAVVRELEALPGPFVDRATVELFLGVGRRRAQQILAPCITEHVGRSALAERDRVITHLRRLQQREDAGYELQRRRRVSEALEKWRTARLEQPQVMVEAPVEVVSQGLAELPEGVDIEAGRITIRFESPQQALEKLLALAMAIGNEWERFESAAS